MSTHQEYVNTLQRPSYYVIMSQIFREQVTWRAQRLDKHKCSRVIIRSKEGNHPIYIAGKGKYTADLVKGWPLYGGESYTFPIRNSHDISLIAEVPGEYVEYCLFI